jgi:hypothetical protein
MPKVSIARTTEITNLENIKIRKFARRIFETICLSSVKVVANHKESRKYPVSPDPNSFENILLSRFKNLGVKRQDHIVKNPLHGKIMAEAHTKFRNYKNMKGVDITSTTSIEDQINDIGYGISTADITKFSSNIFSQLSTSQENEILGHFPTEASISGHVLPCNTLDLRIHETKCFDETGRSSGKWYELGERGSDLIHLGGTTIDATGVTKKVNEFRLGKYDDDDVSLYDPPKIFSSFNLKEGTDWPKFYFATLVIAEKDWGGFADFLNDLTDEIEKYVVKKLAQELGIAIGVASGGIIGALIGLVVGWVVGEVLDWLQEAWSDDIFDATTICIEISKENPRFLVITGWDGFDGPKVELKTNSRDNWLNFQSEKYHAHYNIRYDWLVHP